MISKALAHGHPCVRFATDASLALLLLALAAPTAAQQSEDPRGDARFGPLAWLVGEWQGYGVFPDDTAYLHKSFTYETAGVHLVERTLDIFPPETPRTDYRLHQDFAVYYRVGDAYRVTTFFVEGFVWSSSIEVTADGDTIVVVTDEIENAPPAMRARFTIVRDGPDAYRGIFELAPNGRDFQVLERLVMRRIR